MSDLSRLRTVLLSPSKAVLAVISYFPPTPTIIISAPEDGRAEIQASANAGSKKDFIHSYETGFFNTGKRM